MGREQLAVDTELSVVTVTLGEQAEQMGVCQAMELCLCPGCSLRQGFDMWGMW